MKKDKHLERLSKIKELGHERMTGFEGSIDHCINILQRIKEKGCTHVNFAYNEEEYCSSYNHRLEFFQKYLESDSEYEERMSEIKKRETAKKEKAKQQREKYRNERKALYEKLKKEFEK